MKYGFIIYPSVVNLSNFYAFDTCFNHCTKIMITPCIHFTSTASNDNFAEPTTLYFKMGYWLTERNHTLLFNTKYGLGKYHRKFLNTHELELDRSGTKQPLHVCSRKTGIILMNDQQCCKFRVPSSFVCLN